MILPEEFLRSLRRHGVEFFAGVPDSLLKELCTCLTETLPPRRHVTAANEGTAVALAAGHHLATGRVPVVYLQNSGLGNAVNPLLSLTDPDVYGIPLLLVIGWRGEPGVHDEPQHVKQGRVLERMLEAMEIPFDVLGPQEDDVDGRIARAVESAVRRRAPHAFLVRAGTFASLARPAALPPAPEAMSREAVIEAILDVTGPRDVIVSTTGKASRELYEARRRRGEGGRADFLTVGSMGHCSQIALGIALEKGDRRVYCLDGDGAAIMHLGGLATIGLLGPANLFHVLLNNGAHESVGGQSTGALRLGWPELARAVGYAWAGSVSDAGGLRGALEAMGSVPGPRLLETRIRTGSRPDLGRPSASPRESRERFMESLG